MIALSPLHSFLIFSWPSATIANRVDRQVARNLLAGLAQGKIMIWTPLAYLDPGSGSLFLQLLLGGIAGVAVLGKLAWQRIRSAFGIRSAAPDKSGASLERTGRKTE